MMKGVIAVLMCGQVRLAPMFGGDGARGPEEAAATAPHFCCTLVVAPPGAAPGSGAPGSSPVPQGGGVTACWGWPPPDATAAVAGAATHHFGLTAFQVSMEQLAKTLSSRACPRVRTCNLQRLGNAALQGVTVPKCRRMQSSPACSYLTGTTSHPTGSARRAAKVLWVAATGCGEDGRRRLWLWAVDRLSGVTMNGALQE